MTPQLAMIQIAAKAELVDRALAQTKDSEQARETLAFLVDVLLQTMHVMSHVEREAVERGIAAAEHCSAQRAGVSTSVR